jgi:hypothetical protein
MLVEKALAFVNSQSGLPVEQAAKRSFVFDRELRVCLEFAHTGPDLDSGVDVYLALLAFAP